jgi:hypothetical protein
LDTGFQISQLFSRLAQASRVILRFWESLGPPGFAIYVRCWAEPFALDPVMRHLPLAHFLQPRHTFPGGLPASFAISYLMLSILSPVFKHHRLENYKPFLHRPLLVFF